MLWLVDIVVAFRWMYVQHIVEYIENIEFGSFIILTSYVCIYDMYQLKKKSG